MYEAKVPVKHVWIIHVCARLAWPNSNCLLFLLWFQIVHDQSLFVVAVIFISYKLEKGKTYVDMYVHCPMAQNYRILHCNAKPSSLPNKRSICDSQIV